MNALVDLTLPSSIYIVALLREREKPFGSVCVCVFAWKGQGQWRWKGLSSPQLP